MLNMSKCPQNNFVFLVIYFIFYRQKRVVEHETNLYTLSQLMLKMTPQKSFQEIEKDV